MNYNQYIKNKLINLYFNKEKVGFSLVNKNTFSFLDDLIINVKQYDLSLSHALTETFNKLNVDKKLRNLLGKDYFAELNNLKKTEALDFFRIETAPKQQQITSKQKEELTQKYTEVASKYGLKEFYYSLDPLLNPEQNFNKAILLLNKTKLELDKLQKTLDITEPYKIGNGILSIQINSQEETEDNGYYDFLSNTIRLKDEKSNFPLIHEYIHFIDKTTSSLLLTGKTTQQLYEIDEDKNIDIDFIDRNSKEYAEYQQNRKYSDTELKELFDMSIFTQIGHKKEGSLWTKVKQTMLISLFNKEINQNNYIQEIFNKKYSPKDNIREFKQIIIDWIEEKNYSNKESLKKDINNIFENKETIKEHYSKEQIEILGKVKLFKASQLTDNYFMKSSKLFDLNNSGIANQSIVIPGSNVEFVNSQINKYYQTQKEMLARTIEQTLKEDKHEQLSDRLTTPQLSKKEKQKFFEIIKSWQNITHDLLEQQKKENTSNMVQQVINKFRAYGSKELEKEFKLK